MKIPRIAMCLVWSVCVVMSGCGESPPEDAQNAASPAERTLRIAVIPKGTTHVFWKSVEAGAKAAGQTHGVEIIWKGPLKENDRAQQIQLVQQFVSDGVDGIVLAPLDSRALVGPVQAATQAGIPVVIFDSDLEAEAGRDFVSFAATDNFKGGYMGGKKLAELLNGGGKVVLLRYAIGSASTENREAGFLSAIAESPGIEVLVDNRYAGPTTGEAKTAALNLLDQLRAADGVFCPNESSTYGMLLALRQEQLIDGLIFVGFDASHPLVEALRDGEIKALVVQNPRRMGEVGVDAVVAHIRGETVEPVIDTGVALVTPENLNDPQIKPLIE